MTHDFPLPTKGHPLAELMQQYAEDAKTHAEPWKMWQILCAGDVWHELGSNPTWVSGLKYRRKPKTHTVNGVEIPDLRVSPELGEKYYLADPLSSELAELHTFVMKREELWFERGLCYELTEAGKQAATLHAKSMLGIK